MSVSRTVQVPIFLEKDDHTAELPGITYDLIFGGLRGEIVSQTHPELVGASEKLRFDMGPVKIPETGETVLLSVDIPLIQKYSPRISRKGTFERKMLRKVEGDIASHVDKFALGDTCKVEKMVKSLLYVIGGIPNDFEIPWGNLLPVVGVFVFGFLVDDKFDEVGGT